jgi:hypothetical protein
MEGEFWTVKRMSSLLVGVGGGNVDPSVPPLLLSLALSPPPLPLSPLPLSMALSMPASWPASGPGEGASLA